MSSFKSQDYEAEKTSRRPTMSLLDLKDHFDKLDKLIKSLSQIEKDHMKRFIYIFESWQISNDIGIDSGYFEFLHSVSSLDENLKKFLKECEFISQTISTHAKTLSTDYSETNLILQTSNLLECKNLLLSILLSNLSEKVKITGTASRSFEVNDEIKEMLSFSKNSVGHLLSCPFFTEGLPIDFDPKTKHRDTENANWLNSLLQVYIEEWRTSPKFQEYICKKLAKKLNKDNPSIIGNISVREFSYSGTSPVIRDFLCKSQNELEFNYEVFVSAPGQVMFTVKVPLVVAFVVVEIEAIVRISEFSGKIRLCYTAEDDLQSWYSFADMPDLRIEVFPLVAGKWMNINQAPGVKWIIAKLVNLKLRRYIYPMKRSIKIPKARAKREQYP